MKIITFVLIKINKYMHLYFKKTYIDFSFSHQNPVGIRTYRNFILISSIMQFNRKFAICCPLIFEQNFLFENFTNSLPSKIDYFCTDNWVDSRRDTMNWNFEMTGGSAKKYEFIFINIYIRMYSSD